MYEHHSQPLAHHTIFLRRLAWNILVCLLIIGLSLVVGMVGYHSLEVPSAGEPQMSWVDAYLNASMILSGMGPVTELKSDGAKIFAGTYALYSGLLLIAVASIALAPVVHRAFHRFHMDVQD